MHSVFLSFPLPLESNTRPASNCHHIFTYLSIYLFLSMLVCSCVELSHWALLQIKFRLRQKLFSGLREWLTYSNKAGGRIIKQYTVLVWALCFPISALVMSFRNFFFYPSKITNSTRVKFWENEKCFGNASRRRVFSQFCNFSQTSRSFSVKQLDYELEISIAW